MKAFRGCVGFLLLCSFAVAAGDRNEAAIKEDVKKLQGVWQVTKFVDESGEAAPAEETKNHTFEFQGDFVTPRKGKAGSGHKMKYSLNPSKKPKWMDLDGGLQAGHAIYKIDGDELVICVAGPGPDGQPGRRPTEFKAAKGDDRALFVLKKTKKAE